MFVIDDYLNKPTQRDGRKYGILPHEFYGIVLSTNCYGSISMKYIFLFIAMIPAFVQAEVICKDYEETKSDAFHWSESDFNEKAASESMAALQEALNSDGSIGTCHLPNALALIEGYILKQQAQEALSSKDTSQLIIKYNVAGFCDFIKRSKPCE